MTQITASTIFCFSLLLNYVYIGVVQHAHRLAASGAAVLVQPLVLSITFVLADKS
jgi:hypothetical protein